MEVDVRAVIADAGDPATVNGTAGVVVCDRISVGIDDRLQEVASVIADVSKSRRVQAAVPQALVLVGVCRANPILDHPGLCRGCVLDPIVGFDPCRMRRRRVGCRDAASRAGARDRTAGDELIAVERVDVVGVEVRRAATWRDALDDRDAVEPPAKAEPALIASVDLCTSGGLIAECDPGLEASEPRNLDWNRMVEAAGEGRAGSRGSEVARRLLVLRGRRIGLTQGKGDQPDEPKTDGKSSTYATPRHDAPHSPSQADCNEFGNAVCTYDCRPFLRRLSKCIAPLGYYFPQQLPRCISSCARMKSWRWVSSSNDASAL